MSLNKDPKEGQFELYSFESSDKSFSDLDDNFEENDYFENNNCVEEDIGYKINPYTNERVQFIREILPPEKFLTSEKSPSEFIYNVKFFTSAGQVFHHEFLETASINEIKRYLSILFKIDLKDFEILSKNEKLHETFILKEFGNLIKNNTVELLIQTEIKLKPIPETNPFVIQDFLTVDIRDDYGNVVKEIVIEIENRSIKKPYLGGYKHRNTGVEYHHAFTQTGGLRKPKISTELLLDRDTQTYSYRNRTVNLPYSISTQTHREDLYIPCNADKIMVPKKYIDADEYFKKLDINNKIKIIQRYFRAWKMKKALRELHKEYQTKLKNEKTIHLEQLIFEKKKKWEDIIRKTYPRSRADYMQLYGMLENWKKTEIEKIKYKHTKAPRVAEMALLLDKEVEMLGIIEKHKKSVREDQIRQKDLDFFDSISKPIVWTGYKGLKIEMHTETTQRGRKHKEFYIALCNRSVNKTDRIDLLKSFKQAFESHNCRMINELIDLIKRELDLIEHNIPEKELEILRMRIQLLFLDHSKLSQCNSSLTKRYRSLKEIRMKKDALHCHHCFKSKPTSEFPISSKDEPKYCKNCFYIDISLRPNLDVAPYKYMLDLIRKYEQEHHQIQNDFKNLECICAKDLCSCKNKKDMCKVSNRKELDKKKYLENPLVCLMQISDIYYLVEKIWHGKSIISEEQDLYDLRLVKWDLNAPWSPWNCVLLTESESRAHLNLKDNLDDVYPNRIRKDIFNKHLLGRTHFKKLFDLIKEYERTNEFKFYKDSIGYTPVPSEILLS